MASLTEQSIIVKEKKDVAQKAEIELKKKQVQANERKEFVSNKLEKAEPALIDAQNAVKGVTSGHISEIKGFKNPPAAVQLALEPVICLVINSKKPSKPDWAKIKSEVVKSTFIKTILDF